MIYDLDDLKRHLQPVFSEQQTNVLATCLYEYYQPIVHQREMAAIRSVLERVAENQDRTDERINRLVESQEQTDERVNRLTEAQGRTEHRVTQLAEAQERTEHRVTQLVEAQERTEEQVIHLVEAQKQTEQRMDRLATAQEKTEHRMNALVDTQRETTRGLAELTRITKEVVWGLGDLRKQVGGLAFSVGQGLEAYAMERIPKLLAERFQFVVASAAPETLGPEGAAAEIDVVCRGMEAGKAVVVLCEVKTNITETEVRSFLATTDRVRLTAGADDVRVLFFGYRASEEVRRLIAEHGCLLAFPRGLIVG
ncbi:MAG: hypothetical protein ACKOEX_06475 [Planctomycetia bacterium]